MGSAGAAGGTGRLGRALIFPRGRGGAGSSGRARVRTLERRDVELEKWGNGVWVEEEVIAARMKLEETAVELAQAE